MLKFIFDNIVLLLNWILRILLKSHRYCYSLICSGFTKKINLSKIKVQNSLLFALLSLFKFGVQLICLILATNFCCHRHNSLSQSLISREIIIVISFETVSSSLRNMCSWCWFTIQINGFISIRFYGSWQTNLK